VNGDEVVNELVTISLGSVELAINDLISLRPGSEICFEYNRFLEGSLIVSGCQWAKVRLEVNEGLGKLVVTELNVLPSSSEIKNLGNNGLKSPIT
jgi:hypothetical protein